MRREMLMKISDFNKKMILLGWLINLIVLLFYISISINTFEILLGLACVFAVYIGYRHKSKILLFVSSIEAVWFFSYGLGIYHLRI